MVSMLMLMSNDLDNIQVGHETDTKDTATGWPWKRWLSTTLSWLTASLFHDVGWHGMVWYFISFHVVGRHADMKLEICDGCRRESQRSHLHLRLESLACQLRPALVVGLPPRS